MSKQNKTKTENILCIAILLQQRFHIALKVECLVSLKIGYINGIVIERRISVIVNNNVLCN